MCVVIQNKAFVVQLWKVKVCHGKQNHCNYWRPKFNDKFYSVWSSHLGKTQHKVAMEQNLENYDFGLKDANVTILKKTPGNVIKSNKCNQCDYASSHSGHLRLHLKTYSGEKLNKCNQCDFASSHSGHLRLHLIIPSQMEVAPLHCTVDITQKRRLFKNTKEIEKM